MSDLGKPGFGTDLKLGLATAPTLFAWEEYPEMGALINRRFKQGGDVEQVSVSLSRSISMGFVTCIAKYFDAPSPGMMAVGFRHETWCSIPVH